MICGLAGLLLCFMIVPSVVAVVLGVVAVRQIRSAGGAIGGVAAARVGMVTGIVGVIAGTAFLVAAFAGVFDDDRRSIFSLEVGDCVDLELPPTDDSVSSVPVVACDEPHTAEVFFVGNLNPDRDLDYPVDDPALFRAVVEACVWPSVGGISEFERYVGISFAESEFDVFPIAPDARAWEPTRGQFVCLLVSSDDGAQLVGSARGSRR